MLHMLAAALLLPSLTCSLPPSHKAASVAVAHFFLTHAIGADASGGMDQAEFDKLLETMKVPPKKKMLLKQKKALLHAFYEQHGRHVAVIASLPR